MVTSFIRRRLLVLLHYKLFDLATIHRSEKISEIQTLELGVYSDSIVEKILDPRSSRLIAHAYNPRKIFRASNLILEPRQAALYTKSGTFVFESSSWPRGYFYHSFPFNPSKRREYKKLEDGIPLSSASYYHWMIEDLPTTIAVMANLPEYPLLVGVNRPSYVDRFIETSGRKVIELSGLTEIENLGFLEKSGDAGWPHPADLSLLKTYAPFLNAIAGLSGKRLFVSRRNSSRSPKNEIEIETLFREYGFVVVELQDFDLLQQISLVSESEVIAGVHGAGLTNMLWMHPRGEVIDIVNSGYWTECYHRLAFFGQLTYTPFEYSGEPESVVPIDSLKSFLDTRFTHK